MSGAPSACARQDGVVRRARCRGEVILAAIASPQLMPPSGVGPAAQLQHLGIPLVLERAGVGENLHDHLQVRLMASPAPARSTRSTIRVMQSLNYALFRRGPLTMPPAQLGLFARSEETRGANLQFHVQGRLFPVSASRCTPFRPIR